MELENSFLSLMIVVVLAFLVPVLTAQVRWLRIPTVVGEIVAGIIVGRSGFGIVGEDPWLALLSVLGFAFLMFLSGLEIDFDAIVGRGMAGVDPDGAGGGRWRPSPVVLGVASFIVTLGAAFAFALGLQAFGLVKNPLLMGLILSTTSLGIVVPTLKERRELRTPYGQSLLVSALVADFATLLLISVYVIFRSSGLTLQMLAVLVLLGAFFTLYRVLGAVLRHPPFERLFQRVSEVTSHIPTRAAAAIVFIFIALAEFLGVEIVLGAFLGGVLIALLSKGQESDLAEKLDAMGYGFFIPIFFIMVGVRFDLQALTASRETLLLVPALLIIAYVIKLLSATVFRSRFGWWDTLGAGLLLSSRLTLIIAAAAIGLELGVISSAVNAAIILLAIVTCTVSPVAFNRLVPACAFTPPRSVLIVGADEAAMQVAERLMHREDPVILLAPPDVLPAAKHLEGVNVISIDGTMSESLKLAGAERARTLLALLPDDRSNLRLCQLARATFHIDNVVARVNDPANFKAYAATGASPVTPQSSEIAVLENLASNPNVFTVLSGARGEREVIEMEVTNRGVVNVPLYALDLPQEALIMLIRRGESYVVPRGETRLQMGDVVTLLTAPRDVDQIRDVLGGEVSQNVGVCPVVESEG